MPLATTSTGSVLSTQDIRAILWLEAAFRVRFVLLEHLQM